ncbi:MAG: hypothetical protein RLZ33_2634 [Bacteroidota bacterium]|jgi:hypothetical protein
MSSKFNPFKNSTPIPHNFGQVPPTPNSSTINLTPIILLGALAVVVAAAVAYNYGKMAKLNEKEE